MKKILRVGVILIIIFISVFLYVLVKNTYRDSKREYSSMSGKDTIESFGDTDGRFGIFKLYDGSIIKKDLYDVKNQHSIDIVNKYKEIEPYVYSIGTNGYTKLNYENGEILQSNDLSKFSQHDKEIFSALK